MVRVRISTLLVGASLYLFSPFLHAAKLKSYCFALEGSNEVLGQDLDTKRPLASVSKVFTSLLAVNANSVTRKVFTQFFYTQVSPGLYDVHIKGGNEPYFGRPAFHWLVAKLNESNVFKIRNLTYDENFKLLIETDKIFRIGRRVLNPVSGKDDLDMPDPTLVRQQLEKPIELLKNYDKTKKIALENGLSLPQQLKISIAKVQFKSSQDFQITTNMLRGYVSSPDLISMIKLMNWNSNNHSANRIFQFSGGLPAMEKLLYNQMGLTTQDVTFVNGSGQNADIDGEGRLYNEASCRTVIKVLAGLKKSLENQNHKLEDAMAVVGGDIGSTVSGKTYNNALTNLSVIAKTGTVGTNVTLGGMVSTNNGKYYFFYNVEVNYPPRSVKNKNAYMNQEAQRARKIISLKLNDLIKRLGGPAPIQYKTKYFDLDSFEDSDMVSEASVFTE